MTQIEFYSIDFDEGKGLNGKTFVNQYEKNGCDGFEAKCLMDALSKLKPSEIPNVELLYCYRDGNEQKFVKFRCQ